MQIHISRDGEQFGPYPLDQVNEYLAAGNLLPADQAWHEGAPGWMPLSAVEGVNAPVFAPAPSAMEGMALGALVVGLLALLLGGVTRWGGMVMMIIAVVLGVGGLVLGIIGLVRIKNAMGERHGKGLAIAGVVLSPLAVVLAFMMNSSSGTEKKDDSGNDSGKSASEKKPIKVSKAERLKCVNNLGQICKSFIGFTSDNEGYFPWHLPDRGNVVPRYAGEEIFNRANFPGIAGDLASAKTLLSPCDPGFKKTNQQMADDLTNPNPKGISYGIHHGGDTSDPRTILVFTRNVEGARIGRYYYPSRDNHWTPRGSFFASIATEKDANWQGGHHERNGMGGLEEGMGQIGMSDGSVQLSNDQMFSEAVQGHMKARGLSPEYNGNIWRPTN